MSERPSPIKKTCVKKKILVIDIGGSQVKLMISKGGTPRKFDSGPKLTAAAAVEQINELARDWNYDAVSIGFPAPVRDGKIMKDPKHLEKNWVGFDFSRALGKPARVINDAALQALGSYRDGRMLFLGLGTGLGSALVWKGHLLSLELADLPYGGGGVIEDRLGQRGIDKLGKKEWLRQVKNAVRQLQRAFIADRVVLGGGNARLIEKLPEGVELGHNRNVYPGGRRLWETEPRSKRPRWRVM